MTTTASDPRGRAAGRGFGQYPTPRSPGGLWHWAVKHIPAQQLGLAQGAGQADGAALPQGAIALPNDLGAAAYSGAQPPPGTGTHRMFTCATAVDIETLDVPDGASLAMLNILMIAHTLGRAITYATSEPIA